MRPDPLALAVRELLYTGRVDQLDLVVRQLADAIAVECENAVEETVTVLTCLRRGEPIEDPTPAEEKLLDRIDALLGQSGDEAWARMVARILRRKSSWSLRKGRLPTALTPEQRRVAFSYGRLG